MSSYKPQFLVQGEWCDNAQRFATPEEAYGSAVSRLMVWTMPSDCRAVDSPEPVNYRRVDGRDERLDVPVAPRKIDRIDTRGSIREHQTMDGDRTLCGLVLRSTQPPAGNATCLRCERLKKEAAK